MGEYKKPKTAEEFEQNFSQIKPLMDASMAYYESSRCLFCYDAPCVTACPTGIDIPLFIRQINNKNTKGAAKTIYDSNYFGNACGKVCPTEVLCEGACVYNHRDAKPIEIGRLQSYATQDAMQKEITLYQPAPANGKKVAIIGAGPAGIACACELSLLGYEVHIFEAKSQPSGLTLYGVAPYKITNEEILQEVEYLQNQFGFKICFNERVDSEKLVELEKNYQAIFLGIGLGKTRFPFPMEKEMPNVIGATEIIEQLKVNHLTTNLGDQVIVIGGGNTAMDAASEAARLGAKHVTLAYRRSKEEMGAYEFEYDLAKAVGVQGVFNAQPLEIIGTDQAEAVRFVRTELVDGSVRPIEGSEFTIACDAVIFATGQSKQVDFLNKIKDLELDDKGKIKVKEASFQTTNPMYFAGGDAVNGGAEVVNAAADGKQAALGIHDFLIA